MGSHLASLALSCTGVFSTLQGHRVLKSQPNRGCLTVHEGAG
jgi:hypothetical protein